MAASAATSGMIEWIQAATQSQINSEDAVKYADLFIDSGVDRVEALAGVVEDFDEKIGMHIPVVIHRRLLKKAIEALPLAGLGRSAPVVVIAGPPAAGKGTQCEKIKEKFGYVHISTGDILRENVKNGTDLGNKAKAFMDAGKLVPSDLLINLVKERLQQPDVQQRGCLLDGFPRAPDQAQAMVDAQLKVDSFILIEVPDDTLVERGVGRRLDPETNAIYHMTFKPPPADIVGRLVHRSDDHEDQIRTRLATFHSQVNGILPFFQDTLVKVDGTAKPDDVFATISVGLEKLGSPKPVSSAPVVVIAGPPAAGKGTQCDKIKEKFGYVHISTGDILRENVKNGTELGNKAKSFMDAGKLVPSDLLIDLVKERLQQPDVQQKGCLLDGFPRAPDQAQAMFDAKLKVDKFILIKVPDDSLVERGVGRRLDPESNTIYHMTFKPPPADIIDRLVHRSDDHEDQIRTRLATYHSQIDGIVPFFKDTLLEVDGTAKPDDVFDIISAGLKLL